MKSLHLKLGIGIIVVFGLFFIALYVYSESVYHYYRSRLAAENEVEKSRAVENFLELPHRYKEWLFKETFKKRGPFTTSAAVVLAKSAETCPEEFDITSLDRNEFRVFVYAFSNDWAAAQIPQKVRIRIRNRFASFRPDGKNSRFYDAWYRICYRIYGEKYVDALDFISGCQTPDGRWFSEDGSRDHDLLSTGHSLLALVGMGHARGKFKNTVAAGWKFLLSEQDENGGFSADTTVQAVCTYALCLGYGVVFHDKSLENAGFMATENLIKRILPDGGLPAASEGNSSNMMASCWALLAIKTARTVFDDDRKNRIRQAIVHIKKYTCKLLEKEEDPRKCAALAIAAIFCGKRRNDPPVAKVWGILLANLPSATNEFDSEYAYFGSYAMFQKGGKHWKAWNKARKDILRRTQRIGILEGSWDPEFGQLSRKYGRLYTTALIANALEKEVGRSRWYMLSNQR